MSERQSQCAKILQALKAGEKVSPLGALERWGCFRLASRISELKRQGYKITCEIKTGANGKRWGVYSLVNGKGAKCKI